MAGEEAIVLDRAIDLAGTLGALGTLGVLGVILWKAGRWQGSAEGKLDEINRSVCRTTKAIVDLESENTRAHSAIHGRIDSVERQLQDQCD